VSVYWFFYLCNLKYSRFFKQKKKFRVYSVGKAGVFLVSVLPEAYLFIIRIIIYQCINFNCVIVLIFLFAVCGRTWFWCFTDLI